MTYSSAPRVVSPAGLSRQRPTERGSELSVEGLRRDAFFALLPDTAPAPAARRRNLCGDLYRCCSGRGAIAAVAAASGGFRSGALRRGVTVSAAHCLRRRPGALCRERGLRSLPSGGGA